METNKITTAINGLPFGQRLILAQDIWDSIAKESGKLSKLSMPEWQKLELEKRYRKYQDGKVGLHDWQEVHNELRASRK